MLYQKIGDNKYPIDKFTTFATQMGQTAVRIIGDVPTAENGFYIVDDEDKIIGDMTEYTYLYREDDTCKEYTKVSEEIIPTESFASGDTPITPYDMLSRRISAVNNRVTQLTPYNAQKYAYYGNTECTFYDVPQGNTSVFFEPYVESYGIRRESDRLIVTFDELKQETLITVSVQ